MTYYIRYKRSKKKSDSKEEERLQASCKKGCKFNAECLQAGKVDNKKSSNTPKEKRKPDLVKKLDKVFSKYIRLRDVMPSGFFKCISCGKIKPFAEADCGHYHSRIHMATRFEEDNCHCECKSCNRFSADHLIGYRENLITKIGFSRVERLNVLAHSQKHWLDCELQELIDYYEAETKRLSAMKGIRVK